MAEILVKPQRDYFRHDHSDKTRAHFNVALAKTTSVPNEHSDWLNGFVKIQNVTNQQL